MQQFIQKENELKELGELRLRTLENVIADKSRVAQEQQEELERFMGQNRQLLKHIDDKMAIITDYEDKFDKLK